MSHSPPALHDDAPVARRVVGLAAKLPRPAQFAARVAAFASQQRTHLVVHPPRGYILQPTAAFLREKIDLFIEKISGAGGGSEASSGLRKYAPLLWGAFITGMVL